MEQLASYQVLATHQEHSREFSNCGSRHRTTGPVSKAEMEEDLLFPEPADSRYDRERLAPPRRREDLRHVLLAMGMLIPLPVHAQTLKPGCRGRGPR